MEYEILFGDVESTLEEPGADENDEPIFPKLNNSTAPVVLTQIMVGVSPQKPSRLKGLSGFFVGIARLLCKHLIPPWNPPASRVKCALLFFFPAINWRKRVWFFDLFIFVSKCVAMSGAGGFLSQDFFLEIL